MTATDFLLDTAAIDAPFQDARTRLVDAGFADALWHRRLDVWTADPEVQALIGNRLGWVRALEFVRPEIPRMRAAADAVRRDGFTDVVLLGMGGSSLAPEVLRRVLGPEPGYPRLTVLDSVDPDAVRAAMANAATSLFILASKSGSTIEPNAMTAEARRLVEAAGHAWGSRFVAITDAGTELHQLATASRFREIFVNPSDIGGRYSALSFFGLVPAALMGLDLETLVARSEDMAGACRNEDPAANPGLALGAFMAAAAAAGRDKLLLRFAPPFESLTLWVEQLVAESTGKRGVGIVPIADVPGRTPGIDAAVVRLAVGTAPPPLPGVAPSMTIHASDGLSLGAECVRWEFATAAAGFLLGINPFDEPNVKQAKDATRRLLDSYAGTGRLPVPEPDVQHAGARLTLSDAAKQGLDGRAATAFVSLLDADDYLCLLPYLPSDETYTPLFDRLREQAAAIHPQATVVGFGPRYLHSTGQLHKGGRPNGVFVVVVAPAPTDLPVPGAAYSFSVLETAQALGDFQSLDATGRRALLVQLPSRDAAAIERVLRSLLLDA